MENNANQSFRIFIVGNEFSATENCKMKFLKKKYPRKLKKKLAKKKLNEYNLLSDWQKSGEKARVTCSIGGIIQEKLSGKLFVNDVNFNEKKGTFSASLGYIKTKPL